MSGTSCPSSVSTKLQRIAELARQAPQMVFTTLAHHIDVAFLREAYRRTRKDGAVGVDHQSATEYAARLDENLQALLERLHFGSYHAPPVRRVHIPKGDGRTRPIGVPTFEDKVLQRAVAMILEAVYEQDFLDCSYGFRPGRSAHQALDALWNGLMDLANVYLHEVLDKWFERVVKPRLNGPAFLIRYADDFVVVFAEEDDARRVFDVLPKRFGKYGLTLHPEKTRLIPFRSPRRGRKPPRHERPGTFDLLGFTHHWGKLQRGTWVVMRRTMRSRFTRAVRAFADWCRRARHIPVREQSVILGRKLRGHYNYYGITGNSQALGRLHFAVRRVWKKWLSRRNQRGMSWDRFKAIIERYRLPEPSIMHRTLVAANTVT